MRHKKRMNFEVILLFRDLQDLQLESYVSNLTSYEFKREFNSRKMCSRSFSPEIRWLPSHHT